MRHVLHAHRQGRTEAIEQIQTTDRPSRRYKQYLVSWPGVFEVGYEYRSESAGNKDTPKFLKCFSHFMRVKML